MTLVQLDWYAALFEASPLPTAVVHMPTETFLALNPAYAEMTGFSRSELMSMPWPLLVADGEYERILEMDQRRNAGDPTLPPTYETSLLRKDGEMRLIEVRAQLLPDPDQLLVVNLDITDHRRQALRYREVFDRATVPIAVFEPETGRIVGRNEQFVALFGSAELWRDLQPVAVSGGRLEPSTALPPADRQPHELELPSDQEQPKRVIAVLCRLDAEALVLGSFHDVTEMRRLESVQRESDRRASQRRKLESLGALAGGVAHDFNNLLQTILGYTDLLCRPEPKDMSHDEMLEAVTHAAETGAALTRKLLVFARTGASGAMADVRLDLTALVREAVTLLRYGIGPGVSLTTVLPETPLAVIGSGSEIEQILINLCLNARDAVREMTAPCRPAVWLSLESVPDLSADEAAVLNQEPVTVGTALEPNRCYARLRVSDNGIGMDPKTLDHLFEPLFTTKPDGQGTGLGLATVAAIVVAHGWTLSVRSDPDRGSTFVLHLPVAR